MYCPICGAWIDERSGVCQCGYEDPNAPKKSKEKTDFTVGKAEKKGDFSSNYVSTPSGNAGTHTTDSVSTVNTTPSMGAASILNQYGAIPTQNNTRHAEPEQVAAKGMKWHGFITVMAFVNVAVDILNIILYIDEGWLGIFFAVFSGFAGFFSLGGGFMLKDRDKSIPSDWLTLTVLYLVGAGIFFTISVVFGGAVYYTTVRTLFLIAFVVLTPITSVYLKKRKDMYTNESKNDKK